MEVPSPSCPRCDYDLSGEVSRWNHAESEGCPLTGTCTECGLNIDWKFVLVPHLAGQPWFVESGRKGVLGTSFQTARRALRPWAFWRDVLLEFPIRRGRMASFLVWMLIVPLTLRMLIPVFDGLIRSTITPTAPLSFVAYLSQLYSRIDLPIWLFPSPALIFGLPMMFMLLPWTRSLSKVRAAHVCRIAVYASSWLILLTWFSLALKTIQIGTDAFTLWTTGSLSRPTWSYDSPWYIELDPFVVSSSGGWGGDATVGHLWVATGFTIWTLVFWWFALCRGMRMRDHNEAFLAIAVPCLIAAVLFSCFHPGILS